MKKIQGDLYLEDTEQTKRMKEMALSFIYSNNGEMFRILSTEIGHKLSKKIKKGNIKLPSEIKYGRNVITKEEKFLENLDNYITYIKNNYFINSIELFILIELSLDNKYSSILYSDLDYYNCDNYLIYHDGYRKMFLYNFYENIYFYLKLNPNSEPLNMVVAELNKFNYKDSKDIIIIEKLLKSIFINRNNNLFNSFIYHKNVLQRDYDFYLNQIEWVVSDYYKKFDSENFEVTSNDNVVYVSNDSLILFNILSSRSEIKKDRDLKIEFGIKNHNFCSKQNLEFNKQDLFTLLDRMKYVRSGENYDEELDLLSGKLKFDFWSDRGMLEYLDIKFYYGRDVDYYCISIEENDILSLAKLIRKQL